TKVLVGFIAPWRFESSLRHPSHWYATPVGAAPCVGRERERLAVGRVRRCGSAADSSWGLSTVITCWEGSSAPPVHCVRGCVWYVLRCVVDKCLSWSTSA